MLVARYIIIDSNPTLAANKKYCIAFPLPSSSIDKAIGIGAKAKQNISFTTLKKT